MTRHYSLIKNNTRNLGIAAIIKYVQLYMNNKTKTANSIGVVFDCLLCSCKSNYIRSLIYIYTMKSILTEIYAFRSITTTIILFETTGIIGQQLIKLYPFSVVQTRVSSR